MKNSMVMVQGTVQLDGTLQLDERIQLPAGRVQVTVHSLAQPLACAEDWWQCLQRLRRKLEQTGQAFRTSAEIEGERTAFRAEDESVAKLLRQAQAPPGQGESS